MTLAARSPQRWLDPQSYSPEWSSRSTEMLAMIDRSIDAAADLTFTEYGCGPHSPFASAVRTGSTRTVHRCDLRRWDEGVIACDLNDTRGVLPAADVGVVSGVLEYLEDIGRTLAHLSRFHDHVSASYAFLSESRASTAQDAEITRRLAVNGWVNHLTARETFNLFSEFGRVIAMSTWNERQVILLLRFRDD